MGYPKPIMVGTSKLIVRGCIDIDKLLRFLSTSWFKHNLFVLLDNKVYETSFINFVFLYFIQIYSILLLNLFPIINVIIITAIMIGVPQVTSCVEAAYIDAINEPTISKYIGICKITAIIFFIILILIYLYINLFDN